MTYDGFICIYCIVNILWNIWCISLGIYTIKKGERRGGPLAILTGSCLFLIIGFILVWHVANNFDIARDFYWFF